MDIVLRYLTIIIVIVACILFLKLLKKTEYPFYKNPKFLSPAEREFYKTLIKIIPARYIVFVQIPLGKLLNVKKSGREWWKYRNMIDRKTVDFLLVDSKNLDPKLIIELDDRSHDAADRQIRDDFVNHALEAAGIPCLRVKNRMKYDEKQLLETISVLLAGNSR